MRYVHPLFASIAHGRRRATGPAAVRTASGPQRRVRRRLPLMSDQLKPRIPVQLAQPDRLVSTIAQDAVKAALDAVPVAGPILAALMAPVVAGAFVDHFDPIDDVNSALFQRGGRGNESLARVVLTGRTGVLRE